MEDDRKVMAGYSSQRLDLPKLKWDPPYHSWLRQISRTNPLLEYRGPVVLPVSCPTERRNLNLGGQLRLKVGWRRKNRSLIQILERLVLVGNEVQGGVGKGGG